MCFIKKWKACSKRLPLTELSFPWAIYSHSDQNNEWHLFAAWVEQQTAELILVEGNHDVITS